MVMNPELKEKWKESLLSGVYLQVAGSLRVLEDDGAGYCCLGVLCDLVPEWTWSEEDFVNLNGTGVETHDFGGWINQEGASFLGADHTLLMRLAEKNDAGETFEQISNSPEFEAL